MNNLIINVDDLGISEAVNHAVVDLAKLNRINSTSYMVGGSISNTHKNELKALNIDVGLHLDFTEIFDSPLTASLKQTLQNCYLGKLNKVQVAQNIQQQFDDFEECFGYPPVFVDGHQHVHQFPIIRKELIKQIKSRQATIKVRQTLPLNNDLKSWIIYFLGGKKWQKLSTENNIKSNDKFGGVYAFDVDNEQLKQLWQQWLTHCQITKKTANKAQTHLIMCHPSVPENTIETKWEDAIKPARELEYKWLISDEFGNMLKKSNLNLVNWQAV